MDNNLCLFFFTIFALPAGNNTLFREDFTTDFTDFTDFTDRNRRCPNQFPIREIRLVAPQRSVGGEIRG